MIPVATISALPVMHRVTIPADYMDIMGHMNIMYYIHVFDRGAWGLFGSLGLNQTHIDTRRGGMFALKQHISYLAEVHAGETVAVRSRVLGLSKKRIHFIHFMLNETTGKLAATMEVVGSYANLDTRRTAPFPPEIAAKLRERVAEDAQLDWEAPVSGVLAP